MSYRSFASFGVPRHLLTASLLLSPGIALLTIAGCSGGGKTSVSSTRAVTTTDAILNHVTRVTAENTAIAPVEAGAMLPDLTGVETQLFTAGKVVFTDNEAPSNGLGPVFNGVSCTECHAQTAVGGSAKDNLVAVVTRFGTLTNGQYSDMEARGGPVLQRRSVREFDAASPAAPEVVPPEAMFVSRRTTTPLFGEGLVESVDDDLLRSLADPDDVDGDGISGRLNIVANPETGAQEIGRLGWKAQISSLTVFASDAYHNEMGITSPIFPVENNPQGVAIPDTDLVPDPETTSEEIGQFAGFMRFLAPLPTPPETPQIARGRQVFQTTACVSCHVPALATRANASKALSRKLVMLYSDLLLHDMGAGLADGIRQGQATGNEFRTAPLWGLSRRKFYLHDGRAATIEEAIGNHGGEASGVMARYARLSSDDRADLLAFLHAL